MNDDYMTDDASGETFDLWLGDSCERMADIGDESVDLSVYSPPFASLTTYSPSVRDPATRGPRRVLRALRLHHPREPAHHETRPHLRRARPTAHHHQVDARRDRHDRLPRAGHRRLHGCRMVFHGEVTVDKDPQAQAIRTKAQALMFVTKNRDSSMTRPALADYLLLFRKPGDNAVPIKNDVTNEEWIEWARPVWLDINETNTLNVRAARDAADERHICRCNSTSSNV